MSNREKLVTRIQKLLALASSNPSAAEAEAALLQARKLMAEHDVSEDDVVEKQDKVDAEEVMGSGRMNDLKVAILMALASAHRCSVMRQRRWSRDACAWETVIKLVGFERDRAVVAALNDWAWRSVSSDADRFVKKQREAAKARGFEMSRSDLLSVRRSFVLGFSSGLTQAYKTQVDANPQWALVLATPVEVKDYMDEATNGRTFKSNRASVNGSAYSAGLQAGADHVASTSHKDTPRLASLPLMLNA